MKYRFEIIIRRSNGEKYSCYRMANNEEQAISMVAVPDGEEIVEVTKDFANPNY